MILVAGLSPAWQQIVVVDHFSQGAVNRALEVYWCASGKVLNAGIALAHLGGDSLVLSLAGAERKDDFVRECRRLGVSAQWVITRASTRICTTIVEQSSATVTELVENCLPITADEREQFRQAFVQQPQQAAVVLLIGSLPAGTPATYYRDLLSRTKANAILDASGESLLSALSQRPLLVKPNREELARTLGRSLDDPRAIRLAMSEILRLGAQWIAVTDGDGPVWLASNDQTYRLLPPAITPVNPIGSGDCMAGAIAYCVDRGDSIPQAVQFGIAAAVDNAVQLLPARLDQARVQQLAELVKCESLD